MGFKNFITNIFKRNKNKNYSKGKETEKAKKETIVSKVPKAKKPRNKFNNRKATRSRRKERQFIHFTDSKGIKKMKVIQHDPS